MAGLTSDTIKNVFRKLLYTDETSSPAIPKITDENNEAVVVTSLTTDITGNAAASDVDIATNTTAIALNTAKDTNVSTDLSVSRDGTKLDIVSSDGNNAVLPLADTDNWGVMSDEMFDKLDGIEASATADQTNAEIKTAVEAGADIALGGSPTTTTQSPSDNSTKIATTAYTDAQVATIVDSAPGTLNTLNELAAALNDDASFSTTVTDSIALKAPIASPTFTGTATINGDLTFETSAGRDILFGDNLGAALEFKEGSNLYMRFVTTNGAEAISLNQDLAGTDATFSGDVNGASAAEMGYLGGVTSAIQTQLDAKQATLTFGIANTNAIKVHEETAATSGEIAVFTATGLSSSTNSSIKTQLTLDNVTNESKATMFTSPTFTGTIAIPSYADVETTLDGIATNATAIALNTAKVTNATHTGDVTGDTVLTIAADAVTGDMIEDDAITTGKILSESVTNDKLADDSVHSAHIATDQVITRTIDDGAVTYAKMQNVAADERILGRISGADGVIEELTAANVVTMCDILTATSASSIYQTAIGASATYLSKAGGAMTGAITTNSTFDGVDVAACNTLAVAALPKTGGTMTGDLIIDGAAAIFDQVLDAAGTGAESFFFYDGNKHRVATSANITSQAIHFPTTGSGNFVLLIHYGGTHTLGTWNAYAGSGTGTAATLKWAGGTEPTWTSSATKADIVSFYWDADNNVVYATASLDF